MAEVWLPRFKYERNRVLPPVCVICGAPGDMRMPPNLSAFPQTVDQLKLPLCDSHHFKWRKWARLPQNYMAVGFGLVLLIFLLLLAIPLIANSYLPPVFEKVVLGFVCIGPPAVPLAWMMMAHWIEWAAPLKLREAGPHHFVLSGVSEQFAEAVKNERDGNWLLWQVEQAGGKEEKPPDERITPRLDEPPDPRIQPGPD
jgi:hypothetical protein